MEKKPLKKIAAITLLILMLLAAGAVFLLRHFTSQANFMSDQDVRRNDEAYETATEIETETEQLHPEDIYHPEEVKMLTAEEMEGMYTMLVIGGSSAEDEKKGLDRQDADAILLLNFNTPMKTLYLTSFNADLYTEIPGNGPGRLGNAYAIGGGPLLAETITQNYGVPIDNYGVISLKDAARVMEMPEMEDIDVSHKGVEVIRELIFSLNITDPAEVVKRLTGILSIVTHNITSEQMVKLLMRAPGYVAFYSYDELIPYEGMYKELDGYVVPYLARTAEKLQKTMFERPQEEKN